MKSLIIDANNLVHRTFWVAKQKAQGDEDKIDNFHVHFTLNAIKSYVTQFSPDKIYACWDEKREYVQNERKDLFEDYKANRTTDASPHRNNEVIKEFLTTLGIPSLFPRSLEADDVVSYLTSKLEGQKVIISVDKDFLQLVSDTVVVYDPIRKLEYNVNNFNTLAKVDTVTNVRLEDFLTIKCLLGDKSDNVPGVPKYGKVRVKKYLDGLVTLNEEEQQIFDRNKELFCLNKINRDESQAERQYYDKQLIDLEFIEPSYNKFIALCKERSMESVLSKKDAWCSQFFLKAKLAALFR